MKFTVAKKAIALTGAVAMLGSVAACGSDTASGKPAQDKDVTAVSYTHLTLPTILLV